MAAIPVICQSCKRLWVTHNFIGGTGHVQVTMIGNTVSPCPYCGGTGRIPNGVYELAGGVVRYLSSGAVSVADLRQLQGVLRDAQQQKAKPSEIVQEIKQKVPAAEGISASFSSQTSIALAAWLTVLLALITLIVMTRTQGGASLTQTQVEQAVEQALKDAQHATDPSAAPSAAASPSVRPTGKVGWNHHCPCGSRRKYKKCCGRVL